MSTGAFRPLPENCKFAIGTVDRPDAITVYAQYNPKELQIDAPIGWKEHEAMGAKTVSGKKMQFTGMGAETIKVELVFDAYEDDNQFVVGKIADLKKMASVDEEAGMKRPYFCVATWGTQNAFRCVIDSLSVKYTMFSADGTPVRATVTVSLKSGVRDAAMENGRFTTKNNKFEEASMRRLDAQRDALRQQRIEDVAGRRADKNAELDRQRKLYLEQSRTDREAHEAQQREKKERERRELLAQLE